MKRKGKRRKRKVVRRPKATTLDVFLRKANKDAKATFNKATGWLSVAFPAKPSQDVLTSLKRRGFRWKPRAKRWTAKWSAHREDLAKELAGTVGKINITPDWQRKAQHAAEQAAKHGKQSEDRFKRTWKSMKTIPLGQPILVGHHSERGHRAHLKRIDKGFEIARRESGIAEVYSKRARRYGRKAKGEDPGLLHRRVKKLEAEERGWQRSLKRLLEHSQFAKKHPKLAEKYYVKHDPKEIERTRRHLAFTQQRLKIERGKYKASGGIATDKIKLKKGDWVHTTYGLAQVQKVNPKTVKIRRQGSTWDLKIEKSQIRGKAKI